MSKKRVCIFCFIFMMVTTVVWAKPDSAYINNGNGTVTDIETKLMWQQGTDNVTMDWDDAKTYCRDLSLAGYKDWRLPTKDELKSLEGVRLIVYFPNTKAEFYWSSTINDPGPDPDEAYYAWGVTCVGDCRLFFMYHLLFVRAVRGGLPGSLDNLVISPLSRTVTMDAGSITFGASNTGTGIIPWKAAVTAGADWLSISSGTGGTDTGAITCAYKANTATASRTGTIQVTAYPGTTGITGTPKDVTVIQSAARESKVPDTGLTKCYDVAGNVITCPSSGEELYGQDANYTINPMFYTKLDSSGNALQDSAADWSMVRDNVTGLIWEMKTSKNGEMNYNDPHDADNIYYWYDSNPATNGGNSGTLGDAPNTEAFIKALNNTKYGGFSDWRMPTNRELGDIVNYSSPVSDPRINTFYFPNTVASYYWSSTTDSPYTGTAWGVHFHYGYDGLNAKSFSLYARAVRGGQYGSFGNLDTGSFDSWSGASTDNVNLLDRYTDNGDGTVTDTSTELMWDQTGSSKEMTWKEALAYCKNLKLNNFTDWRLPTAKELRSLVDYSRYYPAINTSFFPKAAVSSYWSGTTDELGTASVSCTDFYYGMGGSPKKDSNAYVRAVRGGAGIIGGLPLANLAISPLSRTVTQDAGSTTFSVSNTNIGAGAMPWTAAVTSGGDWLSITSGVSGTNAGTITCAYTAYTGTTSRTGTIQVTAPGATGSPMDVIVVQGADTTACTATIDKNSFLHIPHLSYIDPVSGTLSLSAKLVNEFNPSYPTLILFKLTEYAVTQNPSFSCKSSTLSKEFAIHIPDVLVSDGVTHLWVDMEYSPDFSTDEYSYFEAKDYGVVSN